MKKQLRVVSDLADVAPESAPKKWAKFGNAEIPEFEKTTKSDAEEEESDDLESPKKKRKVVSEEEKAAIKAKKEAEKAKKEAEKAEKEVEKARKEAEKKAEKERKEELARQKKESDEQKKMLKQKMAEKREMSKKRKAGNAGEDAMKLASTYSREELEQMLADETEAFGGMVEDGDNTADDSSHSGEADSSDDDI